MNLHLFVNSAPLTASEFFVCLIVFGIVLLALRSSNNHKSESQRKSESEHSPERNLSTRQNDLGEDEPDDHYHAHEDGHDDDGE